MGLTTFLYDILIIGAILLRDSCIYFVIKDKLIQLNRAQGKFNNDEFNLLAR